MGVPRDPFDFPAKGAELCRRNVAEERGERKLRSQEERDDDRGGGVFAPRKEKAELLAREVSR